MIQVAEMAHVQHYDNISLLCRTETITKTSLASLSCVPEQDTLIRA